MHCQPSIYKQAATSVINYATAKLGPAWSAFASPEQDGIFNVNSDEGSDHNVTKFKVLYFQQKRQPVKEEP